MTARIVLPEDFKKRVLLALSDNPVSIPDIEHLLNISSPLIIELIELHLGQGNITVTAEQMLRIIKHRESDISLVDSLAKQATHLMELASLKERFYQIRDEQTTKKTAAA